MARSTRHTKKAPAKGRDNLKIVYIVAFVVGVFGIIGVDELAGKGFFFLIAAAASFLYWKRYMAKGTGKQPQAEPAPPVQQFQRAPAPTSTGTIPRDAEPVAQSAPNYYHQAPILPTQMEGIPLAYQYQAKDIAMANEVVRDFGSLQPGFPITIVPEPTNQYDPRAIQLWWQHQLLGYVFRGQMQDMIHDFIQQRLPIFAMIHSVDASERKITYSIAFYRKPKRVLRGKALASGRLTASSGEEAQDNIGFCEEDEELSVFYDFEKDRYEVSSSMGYIGCLPKKMEEYGEAATYIVDEIGETDAGKAYVVVSAYPLKGE